MLAIDIEKPILMPLLTKLLNFRLAGRRPRVNARKISFTPNLVLVIYFGRDLTEGFTLILSSKNEGT